MDAKANQDDVVDLETSCGMFGEGSSGPWVKMAEANFSE
jgi:hypothetical protein